MVEQQNPIETYINQNTWKIKENANSGYSFSGLQLFIAEGQIKDYLLNDVYTKDISKAHKNNYIYIHDLGLGVTVYCMGHDLKTVLREGFNGVKGKVYSKPPKHYRTALNQMINYLFTCQSEIAGANAFSNVDTLLAPFVKIENLSYKEVKQGMQEFIFSINMPNRVGFQAVFSNVTFDIKCPDMFKKEKPIIDGKELEFTYGDCDKEIGMITRAFFEIMMEGDGLGQPFTFPIPTVNLHKNFVWDDEVGKIIFEATARYGTPNFQNFINSDMKPEDTYSMCPLKWDTKILVKTSKGNKVMNIEEIYKNQNRDATHKIFYNGKWSHAKANYNGKQPIYKIYLINGEEIYFGENHLQPVYQKGTIMAKYLQVGDYLPFNNKLYEEKLGNYDLGYIIGLYAGDGSTDGESLTFSLNKNTDKEASKKTKKYFENLGFNTNETIKDELLTLRINGKQSKEFITRYISGTALTKEFNQIIFDMSKETRQGILDGWYQADGGNSGRIYTFSKSLYEQFKTICTSLGYVCKLDYIDTRENRLSNNPCYVIKYLKAKNRKDLFLTSENKIYIAINKIEKLKQERVFCFEAYNQENMFILANGLETHNCRLRLDMKTLIKNSGGTFGSSPNTGSIGVVTMNLPRIAYEARHDKKFETEEEALAHLYKKLDKYMDLGRDSLEIKRDMITKNLGRGLMPYVQRYVGHFNNHFSTIAIVGGNEMALNFIGKDLSTKEGQDFMENTLKYMETKIQNYQETTGNYYNLEQAPAESAAYKLAKNDREEFPEIITSGTKDTPYYTNSTHLPVDHNMEMIDMLMLQDRFNKHYNGGTTVHVFVGEKISDWINAMLLVKKIAYNTSLPFFTITPTFSICPIHGYISGEYTYCPLEHSEDDKTKYGIVIAEEAK